MPGCPLHGGWGRPVPPRCLSLADHAASHHPSPPWELQRALKHAARRPAGWRRLPSLPHRFQVVRAAMGDNLGSTGPAAVLDGVTAAAAACRCLLLSWLPRWLRVASCTTFSPHSLTQLQHGAARSGGPPRLGPCRPRSCAPVCRQRSHPLPQRQRRRCGRVWQHRCAGGQRADPERRLHLCGRQVRCS